MAQSIGGAEPHAALQVPAQSRNRVSQLFNDVDTKVYEKFIPFTREQFPYGEGDWVKFQKQNESLQHDLDSRHYRFDDADHEINGRYIVVGDIPAHTREWVRITKVKRKENNRHVYVRKSLTKFTAGDPRQRSQAEDFKNEIECLKKCKNDHDHIIRFIESYTDRRHIGLILLPLCDMNLKEFMKKHSAQGSMHIYKRELLQFFGCLLHAMCFVVQRCIRHRDLKPENILVKLDGDGPQKRPRPIVCDFGLAVAWREGENGISYNNTNGTSKYMAPEVRKHPPQQHDHRTDVWPLGCVFAELHAVTSGVKLQAFTDKVVPYPSSYDGKREKVLNEIDRITKDFGNQQQMSPKRKELIDLMLKPELADRSNFQELFEMVKSNEVLTGNCCRGKTVPKEPFDALKTKDPPAENAPLPAINELTGFGQEGQSLDDPTSTVHYKSATTNEGDKYSGYGSVSKVRLWSRKNSSDQDPAPKETQDVPSSDQSQIELEICLRRPRETSKPWQTVRLLEIWTPEKRLQYWLPFTFAQVRRQREVVKLEWSDYKQKVKTIRKMPNLQMSDRKITQYEWMFTPDDPNKRLEIHFKKESEAQIFVDYVLFPHPGLDSSEPLEPRSGDRIIIKDYFDIDSSNSTPITISHIIWYVSKSQTRRDGEESYRQLRMIFLPRETDITVKVGEQESSTDVELLLHRVYEPMYRSDRGVLLTSSDEEDIGEADACLELTPPKRIPRLVFSGPRSTITHDLAGHRLFQIFSSRLTDWQLLWSGQPEKFGREKLHTGRKSTIEPLDKDVQIKLLQVWRNFGSRVLACRFQKRPKEKHDEPTIVWMIVRGCTETKAKKKHRLIYLSSTDFTTGDLIRLDRMEVCGRKWLEHGNALTLGLIMKNDDDYVTVKRCLYL